MLNGSSVVINVEVGEIMVGSVVRVRVVSVVGVSGTRGASKEFIFLVRVVWFVRRAEQAPMYLPPTRGSLVSSTRSLDGNTRTLGCSFGCRGRSRFCA